MGEAKWKRLNVPRWGMDRHNNVTFAPDDDGQLQSELFDVAHKSKRIRPWTERRRQAFAVGMGYREIFARTGDVDAQRIGAACIACGTQLDFAEFRCTRSAELKRKLTQANFCRGRLCPMCNWRRSQKHKYELVSVVGAVAVEDSDLRLIMLTVTEPNSSAEDFGQAIGRLQKAVARMMNYKAIRTVVVHSHRALEVTCPQRGWFHPHFHILLWVRPEYFEWSSGQYITQGQWAALWAKALQTKDDRIVDIRVSYDVEEIAKYVAKPAAYLTFENDFWVCDSETLETLHYGLAGRRMVNWSRSLSPIRKRLGFLGDGDEAAEDLIDVGEEEDDGESWVPVRDLIYRWHRSEQGRWHYSLWRIEKPRAVSAEDGLDGWEPGIVSKGGSGSVQEVRDGYG